MSNATILLPERFDFSYHANFQEAFQHNLNVKEVEAIILDFSRVEYIDSAALGMMMMWQKRSASVSKKVFIKGARGASAHVLAMANMQRLFEYI